MSINSTEDDIVADSVVLLTHGGLENNWKYYYAVAAVNGFGMVSSHQHGNWTYLGMFMYILLIKHAHSSYHLLIKFIHCQCESI